MMKRNLIQLEIGTWFVLKFWNNIPFYIYFYEKKINKIQLDISILSPSSLEIKLYLTLNVKLTIQFDLLIKIVIDFIWFLDL